MSLVTSQRRPLFAQIFAEKSFISFALNPHISVKSAYQRLVFIYVFMGFLNVYGRKIMNELLKLLSGSEIVAQIISFLLLFFLLRAFAWKRFLAVLDARRALGSEPEKLRRINDLVKGLGLEG